jgi:putative protease
MSYKLIDNGGLNTAAEESGAYLMSTADLCLLERLKELESAGVSALKIEGRMKRMEYVAVVTGIYRQILDQLRLDAEPDTRAHKRDLAQIFNRNFTEGYFRGRQDNYISGKRPNNRGIYIGRVKNKNEGGLTVIKLKEPLRVGDGMEVWVSGRQGPAFTVGELFIKKRSVTEAAAGDEIALKIREAVNDGDRVFKTHDYQLMMKASESQSWLRDNKLGIDAVVSLKVNAPVRLLFRDDEGHRSEIYSESAAVPAEKYPLNHEILLDKLSRLGNTCFYLRSLEINGNEQVIIPFREINEMRRRAAAEIMEQRLKPYRNKAVDGALYEKGKKLLFKEMVTDNRRHERPEPYISVAVSDTEQAAVAIEQKADRVYLYLDGLGTNTAVNEKSYRQILEMGEKKQVEIIPAWPRIQKTEEMHAYIRQAEKWGFTGLMAGNAGALQWARERGLKIFADYSFNVFNIFSVKYLQALGASVICLSPELNYNQLVDFTGLPVEILVHGEILLMAAEHCMLRSAWGIKEGQPCFKDCKSNAYCLEDGKGYRFPIVADRNCKNYIFNSKPLCMLDHLLKLSRLRPAGFRIEARLDKYQKLEQTVASYRKVRDALKKGIIPDPQRLEEIKNSITGGSFTRGHYFRGVQ